MSIECHFLVGQKVVTLGTLETLPRVGDTIEYRINDDKQKVNGKRFKVIAIHHRVSEKLHLESFTHTVAIETEPE